MPQFWTTQRIYIDYRYIEVEWTWAIEKQQHSWEKLWHVKYIAGKSRWDGEIGPGTSLYTFLAIKNQLTINEIMKKNIYPDYHKIRISEQGVV
jgi:hypothetical protein